MHRYTLQELENIFKDKTLGKEIIPFIKNNKIQQDVWLEKYQDKWKLIQTQLSHGLLCPICGTILLCAVISSIVQPFNNPNYISIYILA